MTPRCLRWFGPGIALLVAALHGCALLAPGAVPLGTSLDDVRHSAARPTGEYSLPDGGRRLEFAMGSFAKQTYMLDFDASGKLTASQQVLTEAHLATITPGMTSQGVLLNFGRPVKIDAVGRQHLKVWNYRFADGDCVWYRVSIADAGTVLDANKSWDPACDGPSGRD